MKAEGYYLYVPRGTLQTFVNNITDDEEKRKKFLSLLISYFVRPFIRCYESDERIEEIEKASLSIKNLLESDDYYFCYCQVGTCVDKPEPSFVKMLEGEFFYPDDKDEFTDDFKELFPEIENVSSFFLKQEKYLKIENHRLWT